MLLNVRTACFLSFFFLSFFLVNRSFSQQVRKFYPPPIRHTHHRADPFDPSVAPVLIPLPIVPRILALLSASPSHTLLRISHPTTLSQPPYPLTFLPSYPLVYVCGAIALARISIILEPHPTIFSRYSRFSSLSLPHYQTSNKSRKESFIVIIASIYR